MEWQDGSQAKTRSVCSRNMSCDSVSVANKKDHPESYVPYEKVACDCLLAINLRMIAHESVYMRIKDSAPVRSCVQYRRSH